MVVLLLLRVNQFQDLQTIEEEMQFPKLLVQGL